MCEKREERERERERKLCVTGERTSKRTSERTSLHHFERKKRSVSWNKLFFFLYVYFLYVKEAKMMPTSTTRCLAKPSLASARVSKAALRTRTSASSRREAHESVSARNANKLVRLVFSLGHASTTSFSFFYSVGRTRNQANKSTTLICV